MLGGNIASAADVLGTGRLNVNARRPFLDKHGESWTIAVNAEGKVAKIKSNAVALLQYDEWKDIDRTVIEAAVRRMVAVADLRAAGLEHGLGSIGNTVSLWDRQSDMTPASASMDGVTMGEKDQVGYQTQIVPVPIIHKEFHVNQRRLEASRAFGASIDTIQAEIAGRLVAEKTETMLFLGDTSIKVTDPVSGAAQIYGYTTHPDRNQVDLDNSWETLTSEQNNEILVDVMAMMQASRNARHYGPWVLYIPNTYEAKMDEDYKGAASSDTRTVRQRLLALEGLTAIKVSDFLTTGNVVLVSLNRDVVDLAVAQDVTTVQWSQNGGITEEFKVMAVWVPRLKSDFDGRSGITHLHSMTS